MICANNLLHRFLQLPPFAIAMCLWVKQNIMVTSTASEMTEMVNGLTYITALT